MKGKITRNASSHAPYHFITIHHRVSVTLPLPEKSRNYQLQNFAAFPNLLKIQDKLRQAGKCIVLTSVCYLVLPIKLEVCPCFQKCPLQPTFYSKSSFQVNVIKIRSCIAAPSSQKTE